MDALWLMTMQRKKGTVLFKTVPFSVFKYPSAEVLSSHTLSSCSHQGFPRFNAVYGFLSFDNNERSCKMKECQKGGTRDGKE